jgi:hypothetical protein
MLSSQPATSPCMARSRRGSSEILGLPTSQGREYMPCTRAQVARGRGHLYAACVRPEALGQRRSQRLVGYAAAGTPLPAARGRTRRPAHLGPTEPDQSRPDARAPGVMQHRIGRRGCRGRTHWRNVRITGVRWRRPRSRATLPPERDEDHAHPAAVHE